MSEKTLRSVLLAAVLTGALLAVGLRNERHSSFFAGFAAGAGLPFAVSFLRNRGRRSGSAPGGGESNGDDEDPDR
jgi:hypothetical protein